MELYEAKLNNGETITIQHNKEAVVIAIDQFEKIISSITKKQLLQNLVYLARLWGIQPVKEEGYRYRLYHPMKYLEYFLNEPIYPDIPELLYGRTKYNHIVLEGVKGITKNQLNGVRIN